MSAFHGCLLLSLLTALALSGLQVTTAARHLLQTIPAIPSLPKVALPPLPAVPKFTLPPLPTTLPTTTALPPLPSTQIPTLPTVPTFPKVTLPPLAAASLPNFPTTIPSIPTIPTTIPAIPFFSPPPSTTSP